jgi:hypothetical protein
MPGHQVEADVTVDATSRVRFRQLQMRPGEDGWVIGLQERGEFIAAPEEARRVITLLCEGLTVGEATGRLERETGVEFDVAGLVAQLDEIGFVAAVDDAARDLPAVQRPSLRWLKPSHVRFLLHPLAPAAAMVVPLFVLFMLAAHPGLVPDYRDLAWSRHAGMAIIVNAAIGWLIIGAHELGHLVTARAAGAPARLTVSTRLQFLTAQTDVSGVWGAPRRIRMTVYLAGMWVDLATAGTCLLVVAAAEPHGMARHLLMVALCESLLMLPIQFMVFMRTDIYFVLQDLTGSSNLYSDGLAYVKYLAAALTRPSSAPLADPTSGHPARRARLTRVYGVVLVAGSAACVAVELVVSFPALIMIITRAVDELTAGAFELLDGVAALAVIAAVQLTWAVSWWRRHGGQVRLYAKAIARL